MSHITQFPTADGQAIWVEVEEMAPMPQSGLIRDGLSDQAEAALNKVQTTFEDALDTIRTSAGAIIGKIRGLSDSPDEAEVTFGLKATGEAGGTFVVAKAGLEANYTVRLLWKRAPENPKQPTAEL